VLKRNRSAPGAAPAVVAPPALPLRIDSGWATAREQIRVWDGFSANHFERGEWRECQEICRTILRRYTDQLTPAESATLHDRMRRCEERLAAASVPGGALPPRR